MTALLTLPEACERLAVCERHLRELIRRGATMRYAHLSDADVRAALDAADQVAKPAAIRRSK